MNAEIINTINVLLNFGPKPQFIRKAFDNSRKTIPWKG